MRYRLICTLPAVLLFAMLPAAAQPPGLGVDITDPTFDNVYVLDMIPYSDGILFATRDVDDDDISHLVYFTPEGVQQSLQLTNPNIGIGAGEAIVIHGLAAGPDGQIGISGVLANSSDWVFAWVLDASGAWVWAATEPFGGQSSPHAKLPVFRPDGGLSAIVPNIDGRWLWGLSDAGETLHITDTAANGEITSLIALPDGGVVLAHGEKPYPEHAYIKRFSNTGSLLWTVAYEGADYNLYPHVADLGGGLFAVAVSVAPTLSYPDPLAVQVLLMNEQGDIEETYPLNGMTGRITGFTAAVNGGFWLSGCRRTKHGMYGGGEESFVARLTQNFDEEWVLWQYPESLEKEHRILNMAASDQMLVVNTIHPYQDYTQTAYALNGPDQTQYLRGRIYSDYFDLYDMPPTGGELEFEPSLTRFGSPGIYDFWVHVQHEEQPDNAVALALMNRWVPPGQYSLPVTLQIPSFAPSGYYTVSLRLGQYSGGIVEQRTFRFHKEDGAATTAEPLSVQAETGVVIRE